MLKIKLCLYKLKSISQKYTMMSACSLLYYKYPFIPVLHDKIIVLKQLNLYTQRKIILQCLGISGLQVRSQR